LLEPDLEVEADSRPINDKEVMSARIPGTYRKTSETTTLATSFHIP
jgi:hypothetical protein